MKCISRKSLAASLLLAAGALPAAAAYPWLQGKAPLPSIESRFAPPPGFKRLPASGYAAWLRGLPLKEGRPLVRLHDGIWKFNQTAHAAVIDIDAGKGDLQQCADAVMRLRAEHLFSIGDHQGIHFKVDGKDASFHDWARGLRPSVSGEHIRWVDRGVQGSSHPTLLKYLHFIYAWAGSASLSQELKAVPDTSAIQAGDVIIKGGYPGHAVLVVDLAVNESNGEKAFLLAQSYMPAQDIHILRNHHQWQQESPWYKAPFEWPLITPEWTFPKGSHKRFP